MYYLVEEAEAIVVEKAESIEEAIEYYDEWSGRQSRWDNASVYYLEDDKLWYGDYIGDRKGLCLLSVYHYPTDEPERHREKFKKISPKDWEKLNKALPSLRTW